MQEARGFYRPSATRLPIFGVLDEPVDHFGFQHVTKCARPKPQTAVLGDFVTNRNRFEALLGDKQTYKARNKIVRPATSEAQLAST